jgi:hypothetical protein
VAPVADLPITLPAGRRSRYPANGPALESLLARHDAAEAGSRVLAALRGLRPDVEA